MFTSEFDFELPSELIAQQPQANKEQTKMLVWQNDEIADSTVGNLIDFLQAGDLLVFNDAKVIKAKLSAKILRSDAELELNLDQKNQGLWQALCRPAKKVNAGDQLQFAPDFAAEVIIKNDDGSIALRFNCTDEELTKKLEKYGSIPLPPYIKRETKESADEQNYQTIYAKNGYAAAAPTAGLHFTDKLFAALAKKGVNKTFITLNVGAGTFLPVRSEQIQDHKMHREFFTITKESAAQINETKSAGKRVIAVGTTSLRALESASDQNGIIHSISSSTNIFIHPPYTFKTANALLTNFHLPKSTLFMLISAFIGQENAMKIYQHAISEQYRFYSYGDASLLFGDS